LRPHSRSAKWLVPRLFAVETVLVRGLSILATLRLDRAGILVPVFEGADKQALNLLESTRAVCRHQIDSIEIVRREEVSALESRGRESRTRVARYPFYFIGDAPQRYIVRAGCRDSAHGVSAPPLPIRETGIYQ
jgi:hypothetical protein